MAIKEFKALTPEMQQHFVEKGWVRIEGGVPPENIKRFTDDMWVRLGYDPNDKSTWQKEKIHMPHHREMLTKDFMPKAWDAICEVLGGAEKIDNTIFETCADALIVNLGSEQWVGKETLDPKLLGNWHIDGDWFRHFLDTADQALTVIVLFNDVEHRAGPTYIAPDGIKNVVKWLYEHPEGADDWPQDSTGSRKVCDIQSCKDFVECTGKAGDVFICHPFMPHSASKNYLRVPRIITNPPVTLKEPFNLKRENPDDFTLAERVILRALKENGVTSVGDWHITRDRVRFTPRTQAGRQAQIQDEIDRMKAHEAKTSGAYKVDSIHANGPVLTSKIKPSMAFR